MVRKTFGSGVVSVVILVIVLSVRVSGVGIIGV